MADKRIELQVATTYDGKGAQQAKTDTEGLSSAAKELKGSVDQLAAGTEAWNASMVSIAIQIGTNTSATGAMKAANDSLAIAAEKQRMAMMTAGQQVEYMNRVMAQSPQTASVTAAAYHELSVKSKTLGDVVGGYLKGAVMALGTALLGMFALQRIAAWFNDATIGAAKLAASFYDLGMKTGMSANEVSKWAAVANSEGVDTQKLATGVRILSKNLSDFGIGGKAARETLAELGVATRDAAGNLLPTSTIIARISDAIVGLPESMDKAAIYTTLFGRSGSELAPVLNKTGAEIVATMEAAEMFGAVVSNEAAAAADQLTDQMELLKLQTQGTKNAISEQMVPGLTLLVSGIIEAKKEVSELVGAIGTLIGLGGGKGSGFAWMTPYINELVQGIPVAREYWNLMASGAKRLGDEADKLKSKVGPKGIPGVLGFDQAGFDARMKVFIADMKAIGKENDAAAATAEKMQKATEKEIEGILDAYDKYYQSLEDAKAKEQAATEKAIDETLAAYSAYYADKERLAEKEQAATQRATEEMLDAYEAYYAALGKAAHDASMETTQWMQDMWSAVGSELLSGDFKDAIDGLAQYFQASWGKSFTDIIEQWREAQAQLAAWEAGGKEGDAPPGAQWSTKRKADMAMGAFSALGNAAVANNPKGQQVMAVGSAVAGIASMFGPIGAVVGAVIMAITAIVASLQDNGKKSIEVLIDSAGNLSIISDQFDDVLRDMYKNMRDTYRKYYVGFRELLQDMGVDISDYRHTIEEAFRRISQEGYGGEWEAGKWTDEPDADYVDTVDLSQTGSSYSMFFKDAMKNSMERFNDWIANDLGREVFGALSEMFQEGFDNLGVDSRWANQLLSYWSNALNAEDLFASISQFIHNVIGIREEFGRMQMSGTELMDVARAQAGMSFADQIADYGEGIYDLADTIRNAFDFEDLNAQGEKFKDALKAMGDSVGQYIAQLLQLTTQLDKSTDQQMRQFSRMGLSNEEIIGLDMQEFQSLMDQLMGATTAAEMGDVYSTIQALLNEIAGAGGAGYKDLLMAMLQQAQDAMHTKAQEFADAAAAVQNEIYDNVSDIMGYFTGEAYATADGLSDVKTAAIAAATALWGVAGGGSTDFPHYVQPNYAMGPDQLAGAMGLPDQPLPGGEPRIGPGAVSTMPPLDVHVTVEPDPCNLINYRARVNAAFMRSEPERAGARFNG